MNQMNRRNRTSRREFLASAAGVALAGVAPMRAFAQERMPTRPIPATGEGLPVIGLGSSKVIGEIPENGPEPVAAVLRALVGLGGSVVDTWPRNPANDAGFGRVASEPDLRDRLFLTTKIDRTGREAGLEQFRESLRSYNRETIDLAQIYSMTDVDTHWPSLQEWKAAGQARYIGVTVSQTSLHQRLEEFVRREQPDVVQINYSITERQAEERMLPLLADRGIAVIINRPFMNGAYFDRLEGQALPEWTREFGCESWAQFSLKYILANPSLTCVLTETSNPRHMEENARAGIGPLPDAAALARMRTFIDQVAV